MKPGDYSFHHKRCPYMRRRGPCTCGAVDAYRRDLRRRWLNLLKILTISLFGVGVVGAGVEILPENPLAHLCLLVIVAAAAMMAYDRWAR